ncbi:type II toxin-antitoxin system HicB family antitoxin [Providencia vermicola]|uniref:type II toxin-antitoxin system HicB family antitoxin n=1 Tax=Providencia TaxID=586 RepID=UPI0018C851C1|nr:type II toxin-antitoxin system HicB family antitoxin [Providencia rettgeri]MBG5892552.1 type II toxin-antitoxin system HicB family antitoxin [Providencia rettgeri]
MSKVLKYKGYIGCVEYSIEDEILYGKIDCINDTVTYEAENMKDLKIEFMNAVDDYLETCIQLGKSPDKPMNGSFNIRIGEDLHKQAYTQAKSLGMTLNEYVRIAIQEKTLDKKEFHIHLSQKTKETHSVYGSFDQKQIEKQWEFSGVHH